MRVLSAEDCQTLVKASKDTLSGRRPAEPGSGGMTELWTIVPKRETNSGPSANINGPDGNLKVLPSTSNNLAKVMRLAKRVAAIPDYERALGNLTVHSDPAVRSMAKAALEKGGTRSFL